VTARPIPFAHDAETVARAIEFDKKAWRAGLISIIPTTCYGRNAVITWNAANDAFVVDAGDEQTARWAGYQAGTREGLEVIWHGTFAHGKRWVSQFYVCGPLEPEVA
jgi:hypothetical protein